MPVLLSDDGQVATFQMEDGSTQQVASQFAQPYIDQPLAPVANELPMGAIDQIQPPMPAVPQLPQDIGPDLPPPQAVPPSVPVAPEVSPAEITMPPDYINPDAAPIAEPEVDMPAEDLRPAPPSIVPDRIAQTPSQYAGQMIQGEQEKADAQFRAHQAQAGALEQSAGFIEQADERIAQIEAQKAEEAKKRAQDEAVLKDKYASMLKRHENFKVDPNRGWSGDAQVWSWIGVAIAGIGRVLQGKDPAQNPALDQLMAGVQQRVNLQMAERDSMVQSIGLKRQELTDFRGATTDRLSEYDLRMAGELQRAARLADAAGKRAGSEVERQAAAEAAAQLRQSAATYGANAASKEAEARAAARAARAAAAERMRKAAEEQRRFMAKEKVVFDPATGTYVPDPRFAKPTDVLEQRETIAKTTKAEADAAAAVLAGSGDERERKYGVSGLTYGDGTPVLAGNETEAQSLKQGKANVDTATRLIDKLIAARDKHGFSSEFLRSDEWRTMQGDFAQLMLTKKGEGLDELGVLAGPDLEIMAKSVGTNDPTEIRNVAKGLENARGNIVSQYNDKLQSQNTSQKKVKRYEPAKLDVVQSQERNINANLDVAFAPVSDLAKSDPDELRKLSSARAAALEEVARQAENTQILQIADGKLTEQHASGEVSDKDYKRLRAVLAKAALRIKNKTQSPAKVGIQPVSDEEWQLVTGGN